MTSWSCLHMAWWLLQILLSLASDQRLPLSRLQEAHTLFLYFLWVVLTVTSSVSEQVTQSWEADSRSELATFSLDASKSDEVPLWLVLLSLSRSLVLLKASSTVPLSGSVVAVVGLQGRLVGFCPCGSELGLISNANADVFSLPCVELCLLLALTSWELTWVLLSWWLLSEPLEEQSYFFSVGLAMNQVNGCCMGGVPTKGISGKGGPGKGGVPVWWGGLSEGSRACELSCSGTAMVARTSSSCCVVVANALIMWWRGTAEEKHQGNSLIESVELTWVKTSWKVASATFVLTISHASWPTWSADHHIFEPNPVSPGLIQIPAELWPCWHFASVWGLGECLILPLSGWSLLDGDGGLMRGQTAKSGQRGSAPLLSFATKPPRSREKLSTPPPSLPKARTTVVSE